MATIKYPPRNGDGSFLADTSSLVQIGHDMDFGGLEGGVGGRGSILQKAGWVGKKEKCQERARQGLETS